MLYLQFSHKDTWKRFKCPNPWMKYAYFYIRFEHKFLRNIYSKEELESSDQWKTLENYYKVFDKFLTIVILLESVINNYLTFDGVTDEELIKFLNEKCSDIESFEDLTEMINKTEIKHPQNSKI